MNSLKEKVKAMSAKLQNIVNQSTQPKFAGQGRKLGSLADSGTAGTQNNSTKPQPPGSGMSSQTGQTQLRDSRGGSTSTSPSQRPARPLGIADNYRGEGDRGPQATHSPNPDVPRSPQPLITDDMQVAAVTLFSVGEAGQAAAATLDRIFQNLVKNPSDPKYRQLRRSNQRIADTLSIPGAEVLLLASGFHAQGTDKDVISVPMDLPNAIPLALGALTLLRQGRSHPAATTSVAASSQPSSLTTSPEPNSGVDAAPDKDSDSQSNCAMTSKENGVNVSLRQPAQPAKGVAQQPEAQDARQEARQDAQQVSTSTDRVAIKIPPRTGSSPPRQNPTTTTNQTPLGFGGAFNSGIQSQASTSGAGQRATPASSQQNTSPPFNGRSTKVLLPISPDIEVSEELFQRTPADLKQEYLRARQRLEQNEVLMTRAMREKLKNKNVKQYSIARVRVRFPEGLILQGEFEPHESVTNVFTWVEGHLRNIEPFSLTSPVLKGLKLQHEGNVKAAGLVPSMLLCFNWDNDEMRRSKGICLSEEALRLVQSEEQVE